MLNRLTSLTIYINSTPGWTKNVPSLVSSSPLEYLLLYGTITIKGEEADDLVTAFISTHGSRLKRFALGRAPISLRALNEACTGFTNLEQLFITAARKDLVSPYQRSLSHGILINFSGSSGTRYRKPPNSKQPKLISRAEPGPTSVKRKRYRL